jgi:hypothetical protein
VRSGFEVRRDRLKEVLKAIDSLALDSVLVGVPESKDAREPEEGEKTHINNAQLAQIHEYGAPAANIPPRPFLEPGIMHAHAQVAEDLREGAAKTLDTENPREARKALNKAGMHAAAQVQREFTDNDWPPLSDNTIGGFQKKKKDGAFTLDAFKGRKKTKKMLEAYVMASIFDGNLDAIRGDYKPLIDTGALRRSISYEIRKKG